MNYFAYHETKSRGRFDFPIEYHYVDAFHPRYAMPFHWHMEYELILVLKGTFSLSLESENMLLKPGDSVLVPEGVIHGGTPNECIYECIVFDLNRIVQERSILNSTLSYTLGHCNLQNVYASGTDACEIVKKLFTALRGKNPGYELISTGLLYELMGTIVQKQLYINGDEKHTKNSKRTKQLKKALQLIRSGYENQITLQNLADEAGMAPKYFCRIFNEITGRTPIDYLNYYRIECAGERLILTDESITDIALSCGFNDLSYFSRMFKKYKGLSAKEFRQAGQKSSDEK